MTCCDDPKEHLLSIDEALQILIQQAQCKSATEMVSLDSALGRVVAQNIYSNIDVPPNANSAMDGYAMRWQDYQPGLNIPISQRIAAGSTGHHLVAGTLARIFTGAEIPMGADTVVKQEDTIVTDKGVEITSAPTQGEHIRPAGQDIKKGGLLISQGSLLTPRHIGVLASVGCAKVPVFEKLKVCLVNTGDELQMPGEQAQAGKIYNSNHFSIKGYLQTLQCQVTSVKALEDTQKAVYEALKEASNKADLIITTGGVSVGEEDYVKDVVAQLGQLKLWRLAIKPGKPLAFGDVQGTHFIGLPGNPVAALVTFLLLARPFIKGLQGTPYKAAQEFPVMANFASKVNNKRQVYLQSNLHFADGQVLATPLAKQSSGALSTTIEASGLLVIPPNTLVQKGDKLQFIAYNELFDS